MTRLSFTLPLRISSTVVKPVPIGVLLPTRVKSIASKEEPAPITVVPESMFNVWKEEIPLRYKPPPPLFSTILLTLPEVYDKPPSKMIFPLSALRIRRAFPPRLTSFLVPLAVLLVNYISLVKALKTLSP